MTEFVLFEPNLHTEEYRRLNIELITWITDQLREKHQTDTVSFIGQIVSEYIDDHFVDFICLKPPHGVIYLLVVEREIAGMGTLRKLRRRWRNQTYVHPPRAQRKRLWKTDAQ